MPFTISYGSGDIAGSIATDVITLSTLILPGIIFGEVAKEDSAISGFDMDGIVGLAFNGLAAVTTSGILDNIELNYENTSLTKSFSLYLSSDPDDHTKPSKIMFGYYDLSIVSENALFFYTPVVRYTSLLTYWTVAMTGFEIGTTDQFTTADDVSVIFSVCTYGYVMIALLLALLSLNEHQHQFYFRYFVRVSFTFISLFSHIVSYMYSFSPFQINLFSNC